MVTRTKAPWVVLMACAAVWYGCATDLPVGPRAELSAVHLEVPLDADSTTFVLRNGGGQPLDWQVGGLVEPRLTIHPLASTIPPGDSAVLVVRIDKEGMTAGRHTYEFRVHTGAFHRPTLDLILDVLVPSAAAAAVRAPEPVPFPELERSMTIRSIGNDVLTWTAETTESWLELVNPMGEVAVGEQVDLRFRIDRGQLPRDTTGTITIRSNAQGGPLVVEVPVRGDPPSFPVFAGAEPIPDGWFRRDNTLHWLEATCVLNDDEPWRLRYALDERNLSLSRPIRRVVSGGSNQKYVAVHEDAVSIWSNLHDLSADVMDLGYEPRAAWARGNLLAVAAGEEPGRIITFNLESGASRAHDLDLPPVQQISGISWQGGHMVVSAGERLTRVLFAPPAEGPFDPAQTMEIEEQSDPLPFHHGDGRYWSLMGDQFLLTSAGYLLDADLAGLGPLRGEDGSRLVEVRGVEAAWYSSGPNRWAVIAVAEDAVDPEVWIFDDRPDGGIRLPLPTLAWEGEAISAIPVKVLLSTGCGGNLEHHVVIVVRQAVGGRFDGDLFVTTLWH
jgi:hypothetical protein